MPVEFESILELSGTGVELGTSGLVVDEEGTAEVIGASVVFEGMV
jgi:hypothetical protein